MLEESKRIEEAIKASGLSYMDLEKMTGISHSTIQRYAVGKTDRLPISAIMKLADALNVSAPWIVGWDNLSSDLTSHEKKVITAYRDQPEVQPAVDTLLGVKEKAPSEDGAVLSVAARGAAVTDADFDKLVSEEDTLKKPKE